MIIHSVSDVHIKKEGDAAAFLFEQFLNQSKSADIIILLGDIFDLIVGGDQAWIERYPKTFKNLSELSKTKKIFYVEGNHDFHMKRLFDQGPLERIQHISGDLILKDSGVKICFSHGDDVEIDNKSYQSYKKIIQHRFIEFLASEFVPVKRIAQIGEYASAQSAKRSRRYEVSESHIQMIKDKFRTSAENYFQKSTGFDLLMCGHSHVKDLWQSELGFTYANNGYFQAERSFAAITNGKVEFRSIN
tara:strand:+ start:2018 stop:2755 length:738 start_codon:yes stop_codon:yes gene_type:complete